MSNWLDQIRHFCKEAFFSQYKESTGEGLDRVHTFEIGVELDVPMVDFVTMQPVAGGRSRIMRRVVRIAIPEDRLFTIGISEPKIPPTWCLPAREKEEESVEEVDLRELLDQEECKFVVKVVLYPGCKLSGDAQGKEGNALWKTPEALGIIKAVGSYKWVPTELLRSFTMLKLRKEVQDAAR